MRCSYLLSGSDYAQLALQKQFWLKHHSWPQRQKQLAVLKSLQVDSSQQNLCEKESVNVCRCIQDIECIQVQPPCCKG